MPKPPTLRLQRRQRAPDRVLRARPDPTSTSEREPPARVETQPDGRENQQPAERRRSRDRNHKPEQPGDDASQRRLSGVREPAILAPTPSGPGVYRVESRSTSRDRCLVRQRTATAASSCYESVHLSDATVGGPARRMADHEADASFVRLVAAWRRSGRASVGPPRTPQRSRCGYRPADVAESRTSSRTCRPDERSVARLSRDPSVPWEYGRTGALARGRGFTPGVPSLRHHGLRLASVGPGRRLRGLLGVVGSGIAEVRLILRSIRCAL
jgi:hypothetical protein